MSDRIEGSCYCGAVHFTLPQLPASLNDCQCTHCQKRGALWAYFSPDEVEVKGTTAIYNTVAHELDFNFCPVCACTVSWTRIGGGTRMGINCRLLDPDLRRTIPVRQSPGPRSPPQR
ncbi:MAG: GFA family protein [Devosia sp.]